MKICIIGYGYWGKILYNNIKEIGYSDIQIIDARLNNLNLLTDNYDYYFISTPFETHFEILSKLSNFKNKRIWCEKPLVDSLDKTIQVYDKLEKNNNKLFVDWVYTFNPCIFKLKNIFKEKKIKQIILNRTNNGPVRFDCNSIYDLSTHDLSIIYFLFGYDDIKFKFNEFSILKDEKFGSSINWSYHKETQIIINSSWQHKFKNRICIFITESDEVIVFDDINKTISINGTVEDFSSLSSPIQNALLFFISSEEFEENKKLTFKIVKTLESIYEYKI